MISCSADVSSDSCAAINDEGLAGKIGILHREDGGLREILLSSDPKHWQVFARYRAELLLALWTRRSAKRLLLLATHYVTLFFSDEAEPSDNCDEDTTGLQPSKIALVPNAPSRIAALQPWDSAKF